LKGLRPVLPALRPQVLSAESDARRLLNAVESDCFWGNPQLQNYLHSERMHGEAFTHGRE